MRIECSFVSVLAPQSLDIRPVTCPTGDSHLVLGKFRSSWPSVSIRDIEVSTGHSSSSVSRYTSIYNYDVNVNDITDTLTVRITSVNGADPASVKNLTITECENVIPLRREDNSFGWIRFWWDDIFFDSGGKIVLPLSGEYSLAHAKKTTCLSMG
ncbi:MAG: hypothetical protein Pg6C_01460 [Treponemataceae bacterium]|nr:MAG: hypothetical protein Pg6C_01460 [Treponemataceae bacterium]